MDGEQRRRDFTDAATQTPMNSILIGAHTDRYGSPRPRAIPPPPPGRQAPPPHPAVPGPNNNNNNNNNQVPDQTLLRSAIQTAGVATTAGVVAPTVATAGLTAAGFGSGGIVGGSIAAACQASIGNVVAGSTFAGLQSLGATGGFAILGPVGIGAAAIAGASYWGWSWRNRRNNRRETGQPQNVMENNHRRDDGDGNNGGAIRIRRVTRSRDAQTQTIWEGEDEEAWLAETIDHINNLERRTVLLE